MQPIDARHFFDCYLVRYSTWAEIVDVLGYSHIWGERCLGRILERVKGEKGCLTMAIAGDSHNIPSMPIKLVNGKIKSYCFTTNKAREIVEQDEERAAVRLLNGESFEMWCSNLQIVRVQAIVDKMIGEKSNVSLA